MPRCCARTWGVKRGESICWNRAYYCKPMVLSKLLVNNFITKLSEMSSWECCNFISLMHTARVCMFKIVVLQISFIHIEFTPYAVLYAAYFIPYTSYLLWQGRQLVHQLLQCPVCASEVCTLHDCVVSSILAITFSHQLLTFQLQCCCLQGTSVYHSEYRLFK